ncbi:MAG: amidohydrolase family protein [Pseudolabrys sp.]|nr:amidohydrolase family protein [Pseudolabrys sp.]
MRTAARTLALMGLLSLVATGAPAQQPLEIFDAHMHYNQEPNPYYPLDKLEVFRRNNITGVLATSRPNKGTHQLMDAKAPGLWVVPFIRPYRIRADIQTWFNDPATLDLIKEEFKRGYYRGVGEFHIYGKSAATDIVKQVVNFAVDNNLYLHAHCDEEALLILFSHNPKARIIWAHTGFGTPPARVAQLLDQYKDQLWGELSYRGGITDGSGQITADWKALFGKFPDRFLLGSDTWINERWYSYDAIFKEYRGWLAQLPPDQARRIANGNAAALFGPKPRS